MGIGAGAERDSPPSPLELVHDSFAGCPTLVAPFARRVCACVCWKAFCHQSSEVCDLIFVGGVFHRVVARVFVRLIEGFGNYLFICVCVCGARVCTFAFADTLHWIRAHD